MAQFDVYENSDRLAQNCIAYFLDVQSDLLQSLVTRIVIPLIPIDCISRPFDTLNLIVRIGKENLYLSTTQLCSVHTNLLGNRIANIAHQRDIIHSSVGTLFDAD